MNPTDKNPKSKQPKPPQIDNLFFDVRDSGYWLQVRDRYLKLGARDVRLHLRPLGLRDDIYHNGLREIDFPLHDAQVNRMIDYAGPLAGHRVGVMRNNSGRSFLITEEANGVWEDMPKKSPRPAWFFKFILQLLPDDQWTHWCHSMRIALESIRRGDFRPGQVSVFAGEGGCGKSLLQYIITQILGGRSADPFRYMMSETQFNYDLAWAEHWAIEDPASTTDIRTRRMFGAKLKECTVNRDFSIHQKGKDALLLPIFRRVTISVNDEPENLAVVPPMDASIADKVSLYRCGKADVGDDRKKTWETIMAEIPKIRAWLLNGLGKLPKQFVDARFGIKAWHHPDLLVILSGLAPEMRLLEIVDDLLFKPEGDEIIVAWEGKALDLEKQLRSSAFQFEVDKLLRFTSATGTYLARLAKQVPERVSKRMNDGHTFWRINPPSDTQNKK